MTLSHEPAQIKAAHERDARLPLTRQTLHGVWPALIVPWTEQDEPDLHRFAAEVRAYEGTGVHGLYTGGTTGEFYAMDDAAFVSIAQTACDQGHQAGLPVQIGCTALSTRHVRMRVKWARQCGADGIQIALPFWLPLRDDEVLGFLEDVAEAAQPLPLILYHTPRAKRRLSPALLGQAAQRVPALIGLKDTVCTCRELVAMLQEAPDLAIFGGEHDLLDKMRVGGRGNYSAVTGLNAPLIVLLYQSIIEERWDQAEEIQSQVNRFYQDCVLAMLEEHGLTDSAIDRAMRVAGGVDVGLRCQKPYRCAPPEAVEQMLSWCREHAPMLRPM